MFRCLELAGLGLGNVAPNPMVGAVLVHDGRIIGEGYHTRYGEAHAEVNCLAAVAEADRKLIKDSTMYVSLEPCAHFGKTPPCADLIIRSGIPRVVIGCRDPFKEVDGKGIERLEKAGVQVICGMLEKECTELDRRFFTFHQKERPYVILKWAQTADGIIGLTSGVENYETQGQRHARRLLISNEFTNRLVHKWRRDEQAILVGSGTALADDPELTNRLWPGKSPVRVVIDLSLRLPKNIKLYNQKAPTLVYNSIQEESVGNLSYCRVKEHDPVFPQVLKNLFHRDIQSVLVEGGARLLQSIIDSGLWDEARVIVSNKTLEKPNGSITVRAPVMGSTISSGEIKIGSDTLYFFRPVRGS